MPDPKFEGCWNCGAKGHSRKECKKFKALIKENGGKIPEGYEGAYEKWRKSQRKVTAAILGAEEDESDSDWSDSEIGLSCTICPTCPPSFEHPNPFVVLSDDVDDDEARVVAALQQLSSSISIGPKVSQKQRRKIPPPVSMTKMNRIMAAVKNDSLNLPDAMEECSNDAEVEYIWALMDSGSFENIANHQLHFPQARLRPSGLQKRGIKSVAANGTEISMSEEMVIKAFTDEGEKAKITFQNGDVQMPILSVDKLSANHDSFFNDVGGKLIHRKTGKETKFIKKYGVYFIRLAIPKDPNSDGKSCRPDFAWPGN